MKEKIIELRKALPIPIGEAMQLLRENNEDVEKCIQLFEAKCIAQLCELTGCDAETANKHYKAEQFDFNRTLSAIRDEIYDMNYTPTEGLTKDRIRTTLQWIALVEDKDFGTSLDFSLWEDVVSVFLLIEPIKELGEKINNAKLAKDKIFEGYTDELSIDEFVRRYKRLDDDLNYEEANREIILRITVIRQELMKHYRNL